MLGVLAGRVSIDKLNEVMAERTGLGETGQTYLVAFNHIILTPARTGEVNVWVSSEGIGDAVDNQASDSGLYDDFQGEPVVGAYGWLPEIESALIAEQAQTEAFSPIYSMVGIAVGIGLLGIGLAVVAALVITRSIATPLADLADTATEIAQGDLTRTATVERNDEIGALGTAFNSMTTQLRGLIASLEQRVADRTRDLEQRSAYLLAAAEVGRTAASILETETLVQQVVELIREDFGLYYVGLFLVDPSGEWAELQAGTGEAGWTMMARGHKLRIGGESMIGWSIANREARIALEAGEDAVRLATPELPETRSEAALPLQSRGRIMGALSVQHTMPGAFDQDTIVVLQTMADQVAVALDNASLFAERQEAAEAVQRAYGEVSGEAWHDLLRSGRAVGYRSDERGITEAADIWRPEMEQALRDGRLVQGAGQDGDGRRPLAVPIKVRGEVVGVLDTYKPAGAGEWTPG
ncbi:MAG: GAF domain-containing protein, partial [Anaerolineae bacterium]